MKPEPNSKLPPRSPSQESSSLQRIRLKAQRQQKESAMIRQTLLICAVAAIAIVGTIFLTKPKNRSENSSEQSVQAYKEEKSVGSGEAIPPTDAPKPAQSSTDQHTDIAAILPKDNKEIEDPAYTSWAASRNPQSEGASPDESVRSGSTASSVAATQSEFDRLTQVFDEEIQKCKNEDQLKKLASKYRERLTTLKGTIDSKIEPDLFDEVCAELEAIDGTVTRRQSAIGANQAVLRQSKTSLQLANGWDQIKGSKESAEVFFKVLGPGSNTPDVDRHDNIQLPFGVSYLQPLDQAILGLKGADVAQHKRVPTTEVRHPGWPYNSFKFVTYSGTFEYWHRRYNSIQLVVDASNQVVALQIKNDGDRYGRPEGAYELNPGYYNFVSSRRKSDPDATVYYQILDSNRVHTIKTCLIDGKKGTTLEACLLFIPEPVAACCRSLVSKLPR